MKIGEYEVEVIDNNTVKVGCVTVIRGQIQTVTMLMDTWKPAPKFKVGDFVRVIDVVWNTRMVGRCGRVVVPICPQKESSVGVEFPDYTEGNDLHGQTRPGHGAWFRTSHLELID